MGKNITVGNRKGALWWAFLEDNTSITAPKQANSVEVELAAPASVRYVKLVFSSNTGWPAAQLSELEVYGSG